MMDVGTPAIPQSVMDDDQHTMAYYQALPYAQRLDGEAKNFLNDITNNLIACVKARDYSRGITFWVKQLAVYVSL
ncbi:hypothetical protein BX666DRAFT_1904440 [Dichotomocladium elegans]|nr:hypothetical protein BX666DRAFT_1904440 [Dichotomocladium elegans]